MPAYKPPKTGKKNFGGLSTKPAGMPAWLQAIMQKNKLTGAAGYATGAGAPPISGGKGAHFGQIKKAFPTIAKGGGGGLVPTGGPAPQEETTPSPFELERGYDPTAGGFGETTPTAQPGWFDTLLGGLQAGGASLYSDIQGIIPGIERAVAGFGQELLNSPQFEGLNEIFPNLQPGLNEFATGEQDLGTFLGGGGGEGETRGSFTPEEWVDIRARQRAAGRFRGRNAAGQPTTLEENYGWALLRAAQEKAEADAAAYYQTLGEPVDLSGFGGYGDGGGFGGFGGFEPAKNDPAFWLNQLRWLIA